MPLDWDIIKTVAILNLVLAAFWKLRDMTLAQMNATIDKKIADAEIRADAKFAMKEELREIHQEVMRVEDRMAN